MNRFSVTTQGATTAATTQTMLVVKPATAQGCLVKKVWCTFDSSVVGAGIRVQLIRQSTDGTSAGSAPTPAKKDPNGPASNMTILHKLSAEGTFVESCEDLYEQQLAGVFLEQSPLDEEFRVVGSGNRIGLRIITPAGVSPNFTCGFDFDE